MASEDFEAKVGEAVVLASDEAKRFLALVNAYQRAQPDAYGVRTPLPERAAMLRASLDLTRALAKLRRPGATVDIKRRR